MLQKLASAIALLAVSTGCATAAENPQQASSSQAEFVGTVSAADPRAQEAGMEMLRKGGSATDAAIATMLALTVVEPQSSGIGGGGFYVRGTPDGSVETLDGRETAPAGATPDWFLNEDGSLPPYRDSVMSGLSVGVPGNIALAAMAHERHGKLEWSELFQPAIKLARDGFHINRRLAAYLERLPERAAYVQAGNDWFYDVYGKPRPAGWLATNEELAATLEQIAAEGPSAFYEGELARALALQVAQNTLRDGPMTAEDVSAYEAKERRPVCGTYRGHKICGMGPPSSGGVAVMQMLGQLERFDLASLGVRNPVTWHLFLESQRLAYADRELYLADSDFIHVPVAGLIREDYLASRSALISPDKALEDVSAGVPAGTKKGLAVGDELPERGTSHFAVVDRGGTMISYTSTIEGPFGSGLMVGGFYLNNELTDFSRSPERDGKPVANKVEGGKRPRSSMAPTVVYDPNGEPLLAVGAAGGGTIPVQTARAIIGVVDFGLSAKQALDLPFLMAFGNRVLLEKGTWLENAQDEFRALGHEELIVRDAPVKAGAVKREGDIWEAARDPRIETGLIVP